MHEALAQQLGQLLAAQTKRIVFAESCTAGLVSARLAQVPGISEWHCGSAATYREATKVAWLGVSSVDLERDSAVSRSVTHQMATGALEKTPEAHVAVAVTGHLGPNAPAELDGVVFVAVAHRGDDLARVETEQHQLKSEQRADRMEEAAALVLQAAVQALTAA